MDKVIRDGLSVHAGFPNPAVDASLEGLNLNQLLVSRPVSTFFLRVKGGLWEDRGIFDDDIAVIDRALEPRDQDLVIWWQGDNFVISKYKAKPDDEVAWGVVTAVIHQYRKRQMENGK